MVLIKNIPEKGRPSLLLNEVTLPSKSKCPETLLLGTCATENTNASSSSSLWKESSPFSDSRTWRRPTQRIKCRRSCCQDHCGGPLLTYGVLRKLCGIPELPLLVSFQKENVKNTSTTGSSYCGTQDSGNWGWKSRETCDHKSRVFCCW